MGENIESPKKKNPRYPLTIRMRKIQDYYKEKLQQSLENEENCKKLEIQKKGVNIVKEHILRRKQQFLCHQLERMQLNAKQKKEMEAKVLQRYKINVSNSATRQKIAEKLMNHNKEEEMKINHRQQRVVNIIQKLLTELEEKHNPAKKKIFRPLERKDKLQFLNLPYMDDEEELINARKLQEMLAAKDAEEEEEGFEEYWEDIDDTPKEEKDRKEKKEKKGKQEKREKKKSDSKAETDKSSKKSKASKSKSTKNTSQKSKESKKGKGKDKKKKGDVDLHHAIYPITNPRNRLKPEDKEITADLFSSLADYDKVMRENKNYFRVKEVTYAPEKNFSSKPDVVFFSDFENNELYKQRITIYNKSCETTHCNYQYIISNNDLCNVYFEVEQVGIKKLYPGKGFHLNIIFRPRALKYLQGKIMFLTRRLNEIEFKQFGVPIECEIESVKIAIFPQNVIFRSLPIWKIQPGSYNNFKIIQVRNDMIKDCLLIIRKINDPLDSTSDTENQDPGEIEEAVINAFTKGSIRNDSPIQIINDIIDHIDHIFYFEAYQTLIPPKTTLDLKVYLKNAPFVGAHVEVFEFEFLEGATKKINTIHSETIMLQIEVTGKFIITDSEYIDYNVCVLNSVYQQDITIYNSSKSRVCVGFQLPTSIKQYVSINPKTFFLGSGLHETFSFRFCPCAKVLDTKYYDPNTAIIHFPIKICTLLPKNSQVPATVISVYALLTEADFLILRPGPNQDADLDQSLIPVINLGQVTTHETITAEIEIENCSASTHEFGFLNLPECVVLDPNYGFGILKPNEMKKLKIFFSPSVEDMLAAENSTERSADFVYKLTCTTVYKLADLPSSKDIQNKISKTIEPEYTSAENYEKQSEMLQNISFALDYELPEVILDEEDVNFENYVHLDYDCPLPEDRAPGEQLKSKPKKNLSIILKGTIVHNWTELSHQHIVFPDTPLGSYSVMSLNIAAINNSSGSECVCGYKKHRYIQNFKCHFEVFGESVDISIEPICGDLQKNQKIKLMLISRPTIQNHLVQNIAKAYKLERLERFKTLEEEAKKKSKRRVSKSAKPRPSVNSQFISIFDKASFHNSDYYLAEKQIWSFLKPYRIKATFVFVVTFPPEFCKPKEILYLTTECNVIRPSFTTSLSTQYLDFGPTALSTRPKQLIAIHNISRQDIYPKISPISPLGPFVCSTQRKIGVEMEHILHVPITFTPKEEIKYQEYFEILCGHTVESLLVVGEGVAPAFEITPVFKVCRLQAKLGKSADCIFQIENKCRAPITIEVKKVYELKGKIEPVIKEKKRSTIKNSADKLKKGDKKKEKKSKLDKKSRGSVKKKEKKFSEELTENEEYSLPKNFQINYDEPQYKIQSETGDTITVEPFTKVVVKIRFGIVKAKQPKKKKNKGEKKDTKDKHVKSTEVQTESSVATVLPPVIDKTLKYVAKYNIMLGSIELIGDFVIIGEFK